MTYATQGDPENQSSQSQPPTAPGIQDGLASVDALGEVPGANFGTFFWVEPFCARRVAISEMSLSRPLCCTSYAVFRSESPNVSCEQNLFEHPGQGPRKQKVVEGGPQSIGRGARQETFSQPGDPWRPPENDARIQHSWGDAGTCRKTIHDVCSARGEGDPGEQRETAHDVCNRIRPRKPHHSLVGRGVRKDVFLATDHTTLASQGGPWRPRKATRDLRNTVGGFGKRPTTYATQGDPENHPTVPPGTTTGNHGGQSTSQGPRKPKVADGGPESVGLGARKEALFAAAHEKRRTTFETQRFGASENGVFLSSLRSLPWRREHPQTHALTGPRVTHLQVFRPWPSKTVFSHVPVLSPSSGCFPGERAHTNAFPFVL